MENKYTFEQILKKDGYLIYPFKGISMLPLLEENNSQVRLEVSNEYHLYDVVLFKHREQCVLHRIIAVKGNKYHIMGDNSLEVDKVSKNDILAKMVGYYKGDKYISKDDKEYQEYLSRYIIDKDPYKKKLIRPNDINKSYVVNDAIKAAYRSLFVYSVSPSEFKVDAIKGLSKSDFYNFYLLTIYKKSDHVLSDIVNKYHLDIDPSIKDRLDKSTNIVKNRYLFQDHYKNEISNLLKEHKIRHIYFRGSELRDKFSNPYLRMSNDIDIYVDKSDLEKARDIILNKYHPYEYHTRTVHYTFNLPQGRIQLELHYGLLEEYLDNVNHLIGDPFIHSTVDESNPYLYHMDDNYYYLYHLAHFAKHIKEGEYWLSMLQDSYLLSKNGVDNVLISEAGLDTFNQTINELVAYYLGEIAITPRVIDLEKIIYNDSFHNYVLLNKKKYKNKFVYILRRVFLTPKELTTSFPKMRNRWYLYPYYFFKRLFSKKRNKPGDELKVYKQYNENLDIIYKNIGINF